MSAPYDLKAATAHLAAADPVMARLVERVGPCRLEVGRMADPFQSLLRAIVYQQLSTKAAATIYGRVERLFLDDHPTPTALAALPTDTLRAAGMSRAKAAAAHDLAAKALDGTLPERAALDRMDNAEVVERLTAVRGVGPWTAEMLLIFQLGRPDVLPVTDLGVRRGFMLAYGHDALPAPSDLRELGERWRPYRSVAAWYLWRAADSELSA